MQRSVGVGMLVLAYLPLHRLLDPSVTGLAGTATRGAAEVAWSGGLYGTVIVLSAAFVASRLVPWRAAEGAIERVLVAMDRPPPAAAAAASGMVAALLSVTVAVVLYGSAPTSVDELAQLTHARAVASGSVSLPLPGNAAGWMIQNGILTPDGWTSVYPPLHTIVLAIGLLVGSAWLAGPLMIGVGTFFASLAFESTLGKRTGRLASALLAVTPFWVFLGATHLSHTTAAAALACVCWAALAARDGSIARFVVCGAALGAAVSARPWIGLASGAAIVAAVWLPDRASALSPKRVAAVVSGGIPFAALLFWWNTHLFGHPFRLGYAAAFGSAHGLGFHTDPWGNSYGPLQALAFTGADLTQLGAALIGSPLPAVAVIGIGLLLAKGRTPAVVYLAWGVAAVLANALYWHHGIHLGPRMLFEATPAWIALLVLGARTIARRSAEFAATRDIGAWVVTFMLLGSALLLPGLVSTRAGAGISADLPAIPEGDTPVQVFVHGSWSSRLSARLAAAGMRRDSIETALRRNDVCVLDGYTRWRTSVDRDGSQPPVDFSPLPDTPTELDNVRLSPGNVVRVDPALAFDPQCAREARADRLGVTELELLLWRYPALAGATVSVVRDLGPALNATLIRPGVRPLLYLPDESGGEGRLLPYSSGMELLWRGAAGAGS